MNPRPLGYEGVDGVEPRPARSKGAEPARVSVPGFLAPTGCFWLPYGDTSGTAILASATLTEAKEQRLTLAGRYVLDGLSFKQALIRAGYSDQTARCPKANGLSAKRCVELALQEGKEALPTTLRTSARKLLAQRIDKALERPEGESLTACARAVETVEKVFAGAEEPKRQIAPRSFEDRMEFVLNLAVVCISNSGETPVLAAARLARGNEELAGMFVEAWTERTRQGRALEGCSDSASDDRSARGVEPVGNYEANQ